MPKSVWGPIKWTELHCRGLLHLGMEGEQKWFESFVKSIPCPKCQHHFESYIQQHPPVFETRRAFFMWTVDAHNFVNRALEKPQINFMDAVGLYSKMLVD